MNKLELAINANAKFFGHGTNCIPEVIARGVPQIEANLTVGVKYDANTLDLYQDYPDGDDIAVVFNNVGETLMISAQYGKITADLNPADYEGAAFIDIPMRLTAGSGGLFSITI
jgi:hypothetical protein